MFLYHKDEPVLHLYKRSGSGVVAGAIITVVVVTIIWVLLFVSVVKRHKRLREEHRQAQGRQTYVLRHRRAGFVPRANNTSYPTTERPTGATRSEIPEETVPPYSETAQDSNDMGYYDQDGRFHKIHQNVPISPPPVARV